MLSNILLKFFSNFIASISVSSGSGRCNSHTFSHYFRFFLKSFSRMCCYNSFFFSIFYVACVICVSHLIYCFFGVINCFERIFWEVFHSIQSWFIFLLFWLFISANVTITHSFNSLFEWTLIYLHFILNYSMWIN